jgi:hypothetical protein
VPRERALLDAVSKVVLRGAGAQIGSVEIVEANGDLTLMQISALPTPSAPAKNEQSRRAMGHVAARCGCVRGDRRTRDDRYRYHRVPARPGDPRASDARRAAARRCRFQSDLIAIEAASAEQTEAAAKRSQQVAATLRADQRFAFVANGDPSMFVAERDRLFDARYLLSAQVTPQRFSVEGLRAALTSSRHCCARRGTLIKPTATRDLTGELLTSQRR